MVVPAAKRNKVIFVCVWPFYLLIIPVCNWGVL